jgi:hypothetical protein
MKQTAVEWLFDNLNISGGSEDMKALQQAKAMEKEQIKDAWDNGCEDDGIIDNAEQYYNETYESKTNI